MTTTLDSRELLALLHRVQAGELRPDDVIRRVEDASFEELGFAKLDHQRAGRLGFPEVVFAEGKEDAHLVEICHKLLERQPRLLVTRLTPERHEQLAAQLPAGGRFNAVGRCLVHGETPGVGNVLVLCAGTADVPVAEEAAETARLMGSHTEVIADVGVAGIHRLFAHKDRIALARVLVVVAGMEGALPSVVGGLVSTPLIAVPTSVGYGTGMGGVAALMSMLNSCAPGITVVNIDNGFGAGYAAHLINAPRGE